MEIRLGEAVLMALTNNRALSVQRLAPAIQRTYEGDERAAFDPVFSGEIHTERVHTQPGLDSTNRLADTESELTGGSAGIRETLPTGTRIDVGAGTERENDRGSDGRYATRPGIGVTQALLKGRPLDVNLAALRLARMDTTTSEYELRGFVEALVAEVETAYWEYALANRRMQILEDSLKLAEQQLKEIESRIRVGALPETELATAQAEIALRREALINARSALALARLRLLRQINPDALAGPRQDLVLKTEPAVPQTDLGPVAAHVETALRMRPDLNEARLEIQKGDLVVVQTKNGLLPALDLFVRLGKTGYASSFGESARESGSAELDVTAGLSLEFPIGNRQARSRHERARLGQEQSEAALRNLSDLVRVDVEGACIEVERTREQVAATTITRKLQEEKLRAETAKFNVGRSTALFVAQVQRDLLVSQVAEVDAVVRHLESLTALYRLDGSLLDRRGLSVLIR
jgi:outer membrane protein TolC